MCVRGCVPSKMLISEAYELSLVGELSLYALILYQVILLMLRETTIVAIGVIIVNIKLVFVAASLLSMQYYRVRAKTWLVRIQVNTDMFHWRDMSTFGLSLLFQCASIIEVQPIVIYRHHNHLIKHCSCHDIWKCLDSHRLLSFLFCSSSKFSSMAVFHHCFFLWSPCFQFSMLCWVVFVLFISDLCLVSIVAVSLDCSLLWSVSCVNSVRVSGLFVGDCLFRFRFNIS